MVIDLKRLLAGPVRRFELASRSFSRLIYALFLYASKSGRPIDYANSWKGDIDFFFFLSLF